MPNYMTNVIKMKGIANLPLFSIEEGKKRFDFNKLIPMPEELNIESGSMTDENIIYFLTERCTIPVQCLDDEKKELVKKTVHNSFYETEFGWPEEVFRRVSIKAYKSGQYKRDEMYEAGRRYVSNYQKYGALTWYEWCNTHWNTKWNACGTKIIDEDTIQFDTAWDCPTPIFHKLAEMYPNAKIDCWWESERHQYTGTLCLEHGSATGEYDEASEA